MFFSKFKNSDDDTEDKKYNVKDIITVVILVVLAVYIFLAFIRGLWVHYSGKTVT